MAKSVEFLIVFRMVCFKLFPSLICFDEYANRGWEGGCTFVHGFCIRSIGLELFTWRYGGWWVEVYRRSSDGSWDRLVGVHQWLLGENHLIDCGEDYR